MLREYKRKRDFSRTPEPSPKAKAAGEALTFVIQKHAARRLHYDLRLELDGVLKSWAVPNGPSLDPTVKRLAVMVEDHPLEYQSFEGNIPEGEYGAGEVIVWDKGTYYPDDKGVPVAEGVKKNQEEVQRGLEKGKIAFTLEGQKLKGSFALVRMQNNPKNWLLIKHRDQFASDKTDVLKQESSVSTGRSVEDLKKKSISPEAGQLSKLEGAVKAPFLHLSVPMLATLIAKPFSDPAWIFEPKLDGYRTLAYISGNKVKLVSRNKTDFTPRFAAIAADLERFADNDMVLDGEIVALEKNGRACFQCLQNYFKGRNSPGHEEGLPAQVIFYVFDILYLAGFDLRKVPLISRKLLLAQTISNSDNVRVVEYFETEGQQIFENAVKLGFEGVMAKNKNSLYEDGKRSSDWLKIKATLSRDFVIGGFTEGTGARKKTFGALLLGTPSGKNKLTFVGHVGSGFDDALLAELDTKLKKIQTSRNPFQNSVPLHGPAQWVKPTLVAEVKFAEQTREGFLRAPVFLRLREEKSPLEADTELNFPAAKVDSSEKKKSESAGKLPGLVEELTASRDNTSIALEGHEIALTNLDKILWPPTSSSRGYSKRDLIIYLAKVSPYLLPHLENRPLTLTRYPGGIQSEHFFQKHWASKLPEYVETALVSERAGSQKEYLLCNNLATLLWLGQQANLEFHCWFSRIVQDGKPARKAAPSENPVDYLVDFPDFLIFDIDPYVYSGKELKGEEPELNRSAFKKTCQAALWLKESLDSLSLNSYIKTSGRTGLHIFVPIVPEFDFTSVRAAAKTFAEHLLGQHPAELTVDWGVTNGLARSSWTTIKMFAAKPWLQCIHPVPPQKRPARPL